MAERHGPVEHDRFVSPVEAVEILALPRVPGCVDDKRLLPPGDAALTRRVKAAGPTWTVQEKKGRKTFSRGVWADASTIESIRSQLATERQELRQATSLASELNRYLRETLYAQLPAARKQEIDTIYRAHHVPSPGQRLP